MDCGLLWVGQLGLPAGEVNLERARGGAPRQRDSKCKGPGRVGGTERRPSKLVEEAGGRGGNSGPAGPRGQGQILCRFEKAGWKVDIRETRAEQGDVGPG